MTLLAVERIKLFSTRSPWWSLALIVVAAVGVSAAVAGLADGVITPAFTQFGTGFGSWVAMVVAALAITTEYRFSTIQASFVAVPNRVAVLASKTALVTGVVTAVGAATGLLAWAIAVPIAGDSGDLSLNSGVDWRGTLGYGLVYAGYAVIALGVGMLVRHTAAAVSILLVWALVVEQVARGLSFGLDVNITGWMPFANAGNFTSAGDVRVADAQGEAATIDYAFSGPWGSLAYFALIAAVLWAAGLALTLRRDA